MTKSDDDDHLLYLPSRVLSLQPLEYAWADWKGAYIFTSDLDGPTFDDWAIEFVSRLRSVVPESIRFETYPSADVGYLQFSFCGEEWCELHAAWHGHEDGFENLLAWLGSHELRRLIENDKPATAGMIRVRS